MWEETREKYSREEFTTQFFWPRIVLCLVLGISMVDSGTISGGPVSVAGIILTVFGVGMISSWFGVNILANQIYGEPGKENKKK